MTCEKRSKHIKIRPMSLHFPVGGKKQKREESMKGSSNNVKTICVQCFKN